MSAPFYPASVLEALARWDEARRDLVACEATESWFGEAAWNCRDVQFKTFKAFVRTLDAFRESATSTAGETDTLRLDWLAARTVEVYDGHRSHGALILHPECSDDLRTAIDAAQGGTPESAVEAAMQSAEDAARDEAERDPSPHRFSHPFGGIV